MDHQTMRMFEATREFERWLAQHTPLVRSQLNDKHKKIAESPFIFLRGTIYRWAQMWLAAGPDLLKAPRVLSAGDVHVESFGTWRALAGRLVWGIDDFDEAFHLPYTQDLVRVATSAHLAIAGAHLKLNWKDACDAILEGYTECLRNEGKPFVLEENHHWLRVIAQRRLDDPRPFWRKLIESPSARGSIEQAARRALQARLPEPHLAYRVAMRTAGVGSLGHRRFVALADWRGGNLALEAKALVPSAFYWAQAEGTQPAVHYQDLLDHAVRAKDPFVHLENKWLVRRLSPDSSPIELASLPHTSGLRIASSTRWAGKQQTSILPRSAP
jgi:uncharacterized protein (DUF2252 family)